MSANPAIQYVQSTAPTGTVGVLGTGTTSAFSQATDASYGALGSGITRFSPQVSNAARATIPNAPATFSGMGWRMDTPIFAVGDQARTLAGQTWPVNLQARTTATAVVTADFTVILYLDDREIGRATLATQALTGTLADYAVNVPITAGVISNTTLPKVTMEVYVSIAVGASLAYTVILATGLGVTRVDPDVIAVDATRSASDIAPTATQTASRVAAYARSAPQPAPAPVDTARRVVSLSLTASDSTGLADTAIRSITYARVTLYQFQAQDEPPSNQVRHITGVVRNSDGTPYLGGATVILIREDGIVVQAQTSSTVNGTYDFPRNFLDTHTYTAAAHTMVAGAPQQAVTPRQLSPV